MQLDQEFIDQTRRLATLRMSDSEIAAFFEVQESTFKAWMRKYPPLKKAVIDGRVNINAQVAESMYKAANGYTHPDVKVFFDKEGEVDEEKGIDKRVVVVPIKKHYAPDTKAGIFVLTNAYPDKFSNKQEFTGAKGAPLLPEMTPLEMARRVAFMLAAGDHELREQDNAADA